MKKWAREEKRQESRETRIFSSPNEIAVGFPADLRRVERERMELI